jgi:hypothetical protein
MRVLRGEVGGDRPAAICRHLLMARAISAASGAGTICRSCSITAETVLISTSQWNSSGVCAVAPRGATPRKSKSAAAETAVRVVIIVAS